MHDYSIDRHPKEKIIFGLAFVAIAAAPAISERLNNCLVSLETTGWISSPPIIAIPVFALFVLVFLLFDQYLWRVQWFRRMFMIPDLNGNWVCDGCGILKNGEKVEYPWEGRIVITQSWSRISVSMSAGQSGSESVSASISRISGRGFRLLYHYINHPKPGEEELNIHHGTAEVVFDDDCDSAEGFYFTDQHRSTVGTMTLKKEDRDAE